MFPYLGHGVGLRTQHFPRVLDGTARTDWFEAISENFMIRGGRPLAVLERARASVPLALDTAVREGRVKPGHLVLLQGVGGGFTWGSVLLRY